MNTLLELRAIFKGKVQGVGFRWTVLDCAEKQGVNGTVRNLQDGTVELVAQGSKNSLLALLKSIQEDSGSARIDSIKADYQPATLLYADFRILH